MATVRIIGIVIMLLGLVVKIAGLPGYTPAFITGALLMIVARIYQWHNRSRQNR